MGWPLRGSSPLRGRSLGAAWRRLPGFQTEAARLLAKRLYPPYSLIPAPSARSARPGISKLNGSLTLIRGIAHGTPCRRWDGIGAGGSIGGAHD
jgi:hypothetical protein